MRLLRCVLWCSLWFAQAGLAQAPMASPSPDSGPPSAAGQRVYESTRHSLVQVRTLLRAQDSQASVGSGFLVTPHGHLITNYHVVSQAALQPQRHRLVYSTADGQQGALQLLAVDVVHDLALLKAADPAPLAARGALEFRPAEAPLARGERIFALGNPLDVGFAVMEGAYNGLVERSFVPTIFFGGSLSPGMSGGPAVDTLGRVIGINVAARRDGEQVSFLVPAAAAQALLGRGRDRPAVTQPMYDEIARQLLAHQERLVERFTALPWRGAGHPRYAIPVPQETFMRCWGSATPAGTRGLEFERSDCQMDSRVFVTGTLTTGHLVVRHEAYDGRRLGVLRFLDRYSDSFSNEGFGAKTRQLTAPVCHEGEVQARAAPAAPAQAKVPAGSAPKDAAVPLLGGRPASSTLGPPLRVVMCLRAYRKLPGLYDLSVLATTLDHATVGAQGRFDARGVSHDNALRLAQHYLQGFAWQTPNAGSR